MPCLEAWGGCSWHATGAEQQRNHLRLFTIRSS